MPAVRPACSSGRDFPPFEKHVLSHVDWHAGRDDARGDRVPHRAARRHHDVAPAAGRTVAVPRSRKDRDAAVTPLVRALDGRRCRRPVAGRARPRGRAVRRRAPRGAGRGTRRCSSRATRTRSVVIQTSSLPCGIACPRPGAIRSRRPTRSLRWWQSATRCSRRTCCSAPAPRRFSRTATHVFTSKTAGSWRRFRPTRSARRYARLMGHPITGVPLTSRLTMDLDALQRASKGAGMVFFCNPNNPVAHGHRRQRHAALPGRGAASSRRPRRCSSTRRISNTPRCPATRP